MTSPHWRPEALESVTCNLCGRQDSEPVITRPDGLAVVRCRHCQLQYLNPRPVAAEIARLYDGSYYQQSAVSTVGYTDYLGGPWRRALEINSVRRANLLQHHLILKGARLLEIGCATGEFCREAAHRGADVVGIDLAADVVAIARSRHPGLDFQTGAIESLPDLGGFDVICSFETIEHVGDPQAFLTTIAQHLRPGGHLLVSTPNAAHAARTGPARWAGFQSSFEHMYFFDLARLTALAAAAGFMPVAHYTAGSGDMATFYPRPSLWQAWKDIVKQWSAVHGARRWALRRSGRHGMQPVGDGHEMVVILRKA